MSAPVGASTSDDGADGSRIDGGQIALQVHHHVMAPPRIECLRGREHAVRAGGQLGVGEHGAAAGLLHDLGDLALGRRHDHRTHIGRDRLPPHPHDHRHARDVGERLARQAGGRHARRNDHQMDSSNALRFPQFMRRYAAMTHRHRLVMSPRFGGPRVTTRASRPPF